jgi:quercetin dioxygenase-like cupin family protein
VVGWALASAACTAPVAAPVTPLQAPLADQTASDERRVAAIGHSMTQLSPAANLCWAVAAADDFRLAGGVRALIAVESGRARVELVEDTAADPVLATCLREVLAAYRWPAELVGEVVELPFSFAAPRGQNVVDRRMVPAAVQGTTKVQVLLDERNSGNGSASLLAVELSAGGRIAQADVERSEAWYVLSGDGEILGSGARFAAGDVIQVPAGSRRGLLARSKIEAAVLLVPGGSEGVARAGALPGRAVVAAASTAVRLPQVIARATAASYRSGGRTATVILDRQRQPDAAMSVTVLELETGQVVPEHAHSAESEFLLVQGGEGTMSVDGVTLAVAPSSVIQVPPATLHAATVTAPLRAVQFYTPPGPEQRFRGQP